MTVKFDRFIDDLRILCFDHGVVIAPSQYAELQVFDYASVFDADPICFPCVVDLTKELK